MTLGEILPLLDVPRNRISLFSTYWNQVIPGDLNYNYETFKNYKVVKIHPALALVNENKFDATAGSEAVAIVRIVIEKEVIKDDFARAYRTD